VSRISLEDSAVETHMWLGCLFSTWTATGRDRQKQASCRFVASRVDMPKRSIEEVLGEHTVAEVWDRYNELRSTSSLLYDVSMKKHCCLGQNSLHPQKWPTLTVFSVFFPSSAGSLLVYSQAVAGYFAIPAENLSVHRLYVFHAIDGI
jgi:hypothetical protein